MSKISALVLALVLSSGLLQAQADGASLTGRLTDPSGALVVDAKLTVVNTATNVRYESTTNSAGIYYLTDLSPGVYRIEVQKPGFKTLIKPDVILHVEDALQFDFTMTLGAASESITVEASTPFAPIAPGSLSTVVDRQFVENLPLNGRSFQSLFQLAPGVTIATTSFYDQGQFHVNGQRASANYYTVDGVSANFGVAAGPLGQSAGGLLPSLTTTGGFNALASVDAVQEFRVQTSTFSAEYGRMPGAQIEISTRSGTNQFHGTLFDYFRNDKLDANDWFANQQGKPKPAERQNDFGGVWGGPLRKDRTFFFLSYEGLRLRQPQVVIASVPDLLLRENAPTPLQPILRAFPIPNGPDLGGGLAQFSAGISTPSQVDAGSVRIDHTFDQVSLFGRFNDAPSSATAYPGEVFAPSNLEAIQFDTRTATVGANWSISSSLSNTVRFNYSRSHGYSSYTLTHTGGAVPLSLSKVLPSFSDPATSAFQFFCCSNNSGFLVGANATNRQRQFNAVDNFAYVKGAHQIKLGVDYRRLAPTYGRRAYDNQFNYSTDAAVLANMPDRVYVNAAGGGAAGLQVVTNNVSVFGQDTWRVSRRLTLSYGLRWEFNPVPHVTNRAAPWVVDQVANIATTKLVSPGAPLWHAAAANFAPRIGVAYQLSDARLWATVLRGGAGVFYDVGSGQLGDVFAYNAQYYGQTMYDSNVAFPLTAGQGEPPPLAGTALPISRAAVFDPHLTLPYTVQWNLTIDQGLGRDQTLTASYAGAAGRRLLRQTFYSNPSPSFNTLLVTTNGATSDYDALQLQFRRRASQGLQVVASYTWSHSIDTASSDGYFLTTPPGRASSDFDIRHTFSLAISYNVPTPTSNGLARALLAGWSVDAIDVMRTGQPLTVLNKNMLLGGSYTGVLANVVPGAPLFLQDPNVAGGRRINPNAFTAPPAGQVGNAPRNFLRGFGAWQEDVAVRREFLLSERFRLQFRGEFFNIFNHPNFANPATVLTRPYFGVSTSMLGRSLGSGGTAGGFAPLYQIGGPRSIQLALKLQF